MLEYLLAASSSEILEPPILLGLFTLLLGAVVVFFGMLVLVFCVSLVGKFLAAKQKKDDNAKEENNEVEEPAVVQETSADEGEIPENVRVAIIAAVTAYLEDEKPQNEFTVKKIKKLRN